MRPTPPRVDRFDPRLDAGGPPLDGFGPPVDRFGLPLDQLGPPLDENDPAVDRRHPAVDRNGPAVDAIHPAVDQIHPALDAFDPAVDQSGPPVDGPHPPGEAMSRDIPRIHLRRSARGATVPALSCLPPTIFPAAASSSPAGPASSDRPWSGRSIVAVSTIFWSPISWVRMRNGRISTPLRFADYIEADESGSTGVEDRLPFARQHQAPSFISAPARRRPSANAAYLIRQQLPLHQEARWRIGALRRSLRFVYASSAATYGDGTHGMVDASPTTSAGRAPPTQHVRVLQAPVRRLYALRLGNSCASRHRA